VKKPQRRGPSPSVPIDTLAARAAEALQQERFKEAVELFKLVVRQEPRPEWRESLAAAYAGRARILAAKGMFKEAAMVLENTLAPDGTLREPLLYLKCLIREGQQQQQQQKAAAYALQHVSSGRSLPAAEQTALEELVAALLVTVPSRPEPADGTPSERTRWIELSAASRDALAAWISGTSAEEIDRHLNRISLRSPFRPVRLLLKSLTTEPRDAERTRRLLETIDTGSPFFPFRQAVEAVLGERELDADGWNRLSPAQRAFVAETRGLPAEAAQFLARSADAARSGPGSLFAFLLKQSDLPQADVRSACLNLLPEIPDRLPQFEKTFGPLSKAERHRVQALAAEARNDWEAAERSWRATVVAITEAGEDRQAGLSRGVIFRHLAHLAGEHQEIEGDDFLGDPVIFYLERSREADPDHIPTVLELIGHYRTESRDKDWHQVVEDAIQRFPEDSQVLLQATESAIARKAYKKAAGFARRLLKIDPINPGVRRQMIEAQVAHARKQMRSKRADLAAKELSGAAEWERSDAPSAVLRIARGLVALQTGQKEQAEAWLREGVDLAGGGVAGWFRAVLEAELMNAATGDAGRLRKELAHARETPPTKAAVMTIVTALGQPEAREAKWAVAGLLLGTQAWLLQAADFDWSPAEFQALAEVLVRFEAFDLLQQYARAGRYRESTNPIWRFHEIVARTGGEADRLSMAETDNLEAMAQAAASRQDFHTANRIRRFVFGNGGAPFGRRRRDSPSAPPDSFDFDDLDTDELLESVMDEMAGRSGDKLRRLVADFGREGAVAHMVKELRSDPLGRRMPEPVLWDVCEAMVATAMEGVRGGQGAAARRVPF